MFCVIRLKSSKEILVINIKWIRNFNAVKFHNRGLKFNAKQIVFYSANENDDADFSVNVAELFPPQFPSLYEAVVCKFFGKSETPFFY